MHNVNRMSNKEFLIKNIAYALAVMIVYRSICFKNINGHSYTWSKLFLWTLLALFVGLGIIATHEKRRNYLSVLIAVLPAFEVYTLIAYMPYLRKLFMILTVLSAGFSTLFFTLAFCQKRTDGNGKTIAPKKLFIHGVLGARTIATLCLAAAVAYVASSYIMGNSLLHSSVRPESSHYSEDNTVANNIETVCLFRDSIWDTLSIVERLDALQVIANIERNYLGVPTPLIVEAGALREGRLGQYDARTYRITVDADHLLYGSAEDLLDTLCHEAFHAYEHSLVDAYDSLDDSSKALMLFNNINAYKEELSGHSGSLDFYDYYDQWVEIDARAYAERSTRAYLMWVDEYAMVMQPV